MDELDPVKIEAVVALMRRLGIVSLGSITLGPVPEAPADGKPTPEALAEFFQEPSPDDLLAWSTTGPLPSELRAAERPPEE